MPPRAHSLGVSIVGLGRIAEGFDSPAGAAISTHIKACLADPRWRIERISDSDPVRARQVRERWNLDAEIVQPESIVARGGDALCIATPDPTHAGFLADARAGKWRAVVCEKPAGTVARGRAEAVAALQAGGAAVVINHLRRQIPGIDPLAARVARGEFGRPVTCVVHCSGGLLHNGIHAIDLLTAMLGRLQCGPVHLVRPSSFGGAADPTASFVAEITGRSGPATLLYAAVDPSEQTVFDVDMRFERARIVIDDRLGVRLKLLQANAAPVPGYAPELRPTLEWRDDPPSLMARLWSNVADHLLENAPLRAEGSKMLASYDLYSQIADRIAGEAGR